MKKSKIWVGISAWVLTAISPAAFSAVQDTETLHVLSAVKPGNDMHDRQSLFGYTGQTLQIAVASGEEDQAGQADVLSGAGHDEAFMAQLLMIKGHLLVGKELADLGRWDDAHAHFRHSIEEVYPNIDDNLANRNVEPFKNELQDLIAHVDAREAGEVFEKDYAEAIAMINQAIASIHADIRTSPDFVLEVASRLLKQAANEYEVAVEAENVVDIHEYQDSLGFIRAAHDLIQGISDQLKARDDALYEQMMDQFTKLDAIWPSPVLPAIAIASENEVHDTVSQIERIMKELKSHPRINHI